ncbi:hypothetical protein ONS95_010606 [Cadophora gregata]|uniref:uncharacterized protein n=1 Tax=Cadophora gregata TaxID=51156 RepID=UPI0026DB8A73|nr:uncharacterized protein ONS95_010606 [Cadophora gregata]KAK0122365.1 hypothetical protein ONS95_010606 [Cadophora gregata]KAK0127844.1 hypothetical protein ONS96_007345 [Cadophora gregata f. sp. sojae]
MSLSLTKLQPPSSADVIVPNTSMATESAVDDTNIYEHLENYPWDNDKEFQGGLTAILGPNPSPSQLEDLTLRAQCFYLSRKKSIPIDFNGYKAYLESKQSPSKAVEASISPSASPSNTQSNSTPITQATSTQSQAQAQPATTNTPNMALSNTPTYPTSFTSPSTTVTPGAQPGAPYPRSFAEIVALIQSGEPIPGIREIDDTPMGLAASSPSVMPKRRKPWEKDVPEEIIQGRGPGTFGDHRDHQIQQEYPDA